jgi:hypothetical protein
MQVAAPTATRLHWIPVEPSWLVAAGLAILAALPQQVPKAAATAFRTWLGAAAWLAVAIWVGLRKPVLGIAMGLLLVAVRLAPTTAEPFTAPILNKDRVHSRERQRWLSEEVLSEDPHGIQERTENPGLLYDKVSAEERAAGWHSEKVLGEHPEAIQERPVPSMPEDETSHSSFPAHE